MQAPLNLAVGAAIRQRREGRGMSQTALAEVLGLSRTTVTNIEGGRQPISLKHVYDAARVLGTTVQQLLPEDPDVGDGRTGRRTDDIEALLNLLSRDDEDNR